MDSQQPDDHRLNEEKMAVPPRKRPLQFSISLLFSLIMLALLVYRLVSGMGGPTTKELPYSEFKKDLFDRQIMVELPDRQDRLEILTIHARLVTQGKDINYGGGCAGDAGLFRGGPG